VALQSVVAAENSIARYAMRAHSVSVLVSTHGLQRSDGYIRFSGEAGVLVSVIHWKLMDHGNAMLCNQR
jgi:hypothetical protein